MISNSTIFKELIIKAKNGDSTAFSEAYELFFTPLYRFVMYKVGDKVIAEDITQATFIKTFEQLDQLKANLSPMAYMYRIASNLIIDLYRKKKILSLDEIPEVLDVKGQNVEHELDNDIRRKIVLKVLNTLEDEQKDVIILKYMNNKSYTEIAELLNKPESTIRQINHRALVKLKDIIQKRQEVI